MLALSREYKLVGSGKRKAYCPPTPTIKPIAGLEPMVGTKIKLPSFNSLAGCIPNHCLSNCGKSFCLQAESVLIERLSWLKTFMQGKATNRLSSKKVR